MSPDVREDVGALFVFIVLMGTIDWFKHGNVVG